MVGKLIFVVIILAVIAGGAFYVRSNSEREVRRPPGDIYDFRKDQHLVRAINLSLSLHAVMSRLTATSRDGTRPEVRYTIDSVSQIRPGLVKVDYTLLFQSKGETRKVKHSKRFKRKKDGTWMLQRTS